ncbi:DUF1223 domain-containing protein [Devosia enhydra]|nr:DUF1223 domain-containing protein [Devosia enhydra]
MRSRPAALFRPILLMLALGAAQPALAGEIRTAPKAVVELFTSQGCSSCPPADAMLSTLGERPEIIALAYHVDYWDYIGWPDTFGQKAHSDRQRAYAESWGSTRIYTPQMVVNGREGVVASRKGEVEAALGKASLSVPVTMIEASGMLHVDIEERPGAPEGVIWLVTFKARESVEIERGENSGKRMDYTHIVTGRQLLGMWEPETGTHLKLPLAEVLGARADGAAVLVQSEENGLPGSILGAASFVH